MKTYPITLAKKFQRPHARTGDPTHFKERVLNGFGHRYRNEHGLYYLAKHHTGRDNYDLWKHRCDEVNAGRAVLSLRQWKGVPYKEGQTPIGLELTKVGIQKMEIKIVHSMTEEHGAIKYGQVWIDGRELSPGECLAISVSDGFDHPVDFMDWFGWKNWEGALIHFKPDFKY